MAKVINENRFGTAPSARALQNGDTLTITVAEDEAKALEADLRKNWALVDLEII
jgi:hypothetical protein